MSEREYLAEGIQHFAHVPVSVKVLKIAEEYGEATQAYIGYRGLNPRKGMTHTADEVAKELADVAITALVALSEFADTPWEFFADRLEHVVKRGRSAASPVPEEQP